jgi:hypothetical protein
LYSAKKQRVKGLRQVCNSKTGARSAFLETSFSPLLQGCQIFLGITYQNGKNIPNYHKIYQMPIKYTIASSSKINPNKNFWFKNLPFGNPALLAFN